MKITVSGWSGAGSTTLAMLLAKTLNLKYVRGTETFRYLGAKLKYENTGIDRVEADKYLEQYFGHVYDMFIDLLQTSNDFNNIVIESDIAAFRIGKTPGVFSIFLLTDAEVRKTRVVVDGRQADLEVLAKRDEANRKFYKELHNIDWFDIDVIKSKHEFILDNSHITIAEELKQIYLKLQEAGYINNSEELINNAQEEEKAFWQKGKDWYINYFKENNLIMTAEEIIEMLKKNFPEELKKFPKELTNIL